MQKPLKKPLGSFWRTVVWVGRAMTAASVAGLLAMMLVTCLDVALRVCGVPVKGAYDVVRVAGAVTIACALPVTTAMKGHIAIEYFFQRLNRRWRLVVDSLMRLLMIGGFSLAAFESVGYGVRFLKSGQVTDTIELPIFWVPWLMAVSFAVSALVVVFHLICPGRELVRS
ncbi:MAG TPA: TRAP transporter small permease [Kiritimatiellia bacterium]|nr:TRAP transporter small permease [Kiritimatiellia bacterium]HRU71255.1 TRAP transporter small permease [Kiritimatiellia bacterium]